MAADLVAMVTRSEDQRYDYNSKAPQNSTCFCQKTLHVLIRKLYMFGQKTLHFLNGNMFGQKTLHVFGQETYTF